MNIKKVERLMMTYKRTGDETYFESVLKEMRGVIINQKRTMDAMKKSNLYSSDDFENMSMMYIYEAIRDYKFICPISGDKFATEKQFKEHLVKEYSCGKIIGGKRVKMIKSKTPIVLYVNMIIKNKLMNDIRNEGADIRKANTNQCRVASEVSGGEGESVVMTYETSSPEMTEDLTITKDMVTQMMDKINKEGKEVHLLIFKGLMNGYTKAEIAKALYHKEYYSSFSSAKTTVTKISKELGNTYLKLTA